MQIIFIYKLTCKQASFHINLIYLCNSPMCSNDIWMKFLQQHTVYSHSDHEIYFAGNILIFMGEISKKYIQIRAEALISP